jgi:hypothetical protein
LIAARVKPSVTHIAIPNIQQTRSPLDSLPTGSDPRS